MPKSYIVAKKFAISKTQIKHLKIVYIIEKDQI